MCEGRVNFDNVLLYWNKWKGKVIVKCTYIHTFVHKGVILGLDLFFSSNLNPILWPFIP